MKIRRKSPGLEGRLNEADTRARGALDVFEQAAREMELAAEQANEVKTDAEVRVMELTQVRDSAFRQAVNHQSKADKIRELFK